MILRYHHLTRHPAIFRAMTGLTVGAFDALAADVLPTLAVATRDRLARPGRQRAPGGGRGYGLVPRDRLLLAVVWLRRYPTNQVLGYRFGVSEPTARRTVGRLVPLLEAAGRDTLCLPDPGRGHRLGLDALRADTPGLAVLIDTFEQRVQRPADRADADTYYSGKKKQHTLTVQVAVDAVTGAVADVADSVRGPTADRAVLRASGLLARLPPGVGALGDRADVGLGDAHPGGLGATPRRKPRGRPRPAADVADNRACARRRITVEHTSGRLRRYDALTHTDRHRRRGHTARVRAVAGLVNRQLRRHHVSPLGVRGPPAPTTYCDETLLRRPNQTRPPLDTATRNRYPAPDATTQRLSRNT